MAVFRGNVAPPLILLTVLLGFWTGMMPGWSGLHTVLVMLVLVVNVHIGLFILSLGLGKTLSLAAAPVLYHLGIWAQEHLSGMLSTLSSIPVIGLTDFSRYALVGGLILGPIVGAVAGLLLMFVVIHFRRMMVKLDEKSEKFRIWYSKWWVRLLDRILIGKRAKDVKSMFVKAKYIRKVGVVLALILVGGFFAAVHFGQDAAMKSYAAETLTNANKAEANLSQLGIDVLAGKVSVSGVQLTDPANPIQNHTVVGKIEADASMYDLLLGKLVLEKVEISEVKFDQLREVAGRVIQRVVEEKPFDANTYKVDANDLAKLDKYVKDAKKVKEQLEKLRNWLPDSSRTTQPEQTPHKYLDYLMAKAPVAPSYKMLAKQILADKIEIPSPLFGNSKMEMTNLSDAPAAAAKPITMLIQSYVTPALLKIAMDYSKSDTPEVTGTFEGFDLSKLQSEFSEGAGLQFQSGLASGTFGGTLTKEQVDLKIDLGIKDLKASAVGKGVLGLGAEQTNQVMQVLNELKTTIRVVGPTTSPRLVFDTKGLTKEFQNALVAAGKQRLQQEVDKQIQQLGGQLGDKLGDKVPTELKDKLQGSGKDIVEGLGGLLGGKKKQEEKKQ
ncbi:MAG: hypothetical protein KBI32_09875 [Phycisphaerae bacterium]|nr:hypothetical protein [Phycisphaerae bacterium]HON90402.1 hypothetical protein [Sedimentisphaerales bacterium]